MKFTKEKRDRLILVGIITVALAAAVWQLVIQTSRTKLGQTQAAGAKAREKYEQAEAFLKQAPVLGERAEQLSREIVRIEEVMANPMDPFSWSLQLIEKAREKHAVSIVEVSPPKQPGPVQLIPDFPYQSVSFTVRGIAYYQDLGKFLADFENEHPYCVTRNLQITAGRQTEGDASLAASGVSRTDRVVFRMDVVALLKPNP